MIYGLNLHMKNVKVRSCGKKYCPIKIEQFSLFDNNGLSRLSLTLRAIQDVCPPVQLSYRVAGRGPFSIPTSGKFRDVCAYSIQKQECPDVPSDTNLPCRCPLQQGSTMVIRKLLKMPLQLSPLKSF
ncbi:hypothetical protein L9F63_012010 [Diploptera punctata]|uniref:Uncharacterized protein n=1 Tax=Diploptera punctata TaxID=6984 RepID=A0AAD8EN73_DIPPU|nr:hypothetical protein L9F63_012010 [Diploptera punctata]